jgi:hypothetical protein
MEVLDPGTGESVGEGRLGEPPPPRDRQLAHVDQLFDPRVGEQASELIDVAMVFIADRPDPGPLLSATNRIEELVQGRHRHPTTDHDVGELPDCRRLGLARTLLVFGHRHDEGELSHLHSCSQLPRRETYARREIRDGLDTKRTEV